MLATCFSEPLGGGAHWPDVGLPCGTLGLIFLACWKNRVASLLQMSKILEQQVAPSTPSKKQAMIRQTKKNDTDSQSKQIVVILVALHRVSPKPQV